MVQITDQKILSEYIMQESHKIAGMAKPPPAVTGVVSWRRSLSLLSLSTHVCVEVCAGVLLLKQDVRVRVTSDVRVLRQQENSIFLCKPVYLTAVTFSFFLCARVLVSTRVREEHD